MVPVLRLQIKN